MLRVRVPAAEEDDPKEEDDIATRDELMELRAEKLRQEIRFETARAGIAEIERAQMEDKEADRLAKPGARRNLQLNIFDVISGHNVDQWIDVLEHWERRDPGKPITIRVNSPGGAVLDGFALFDTILRLRRNGHRVTMHGTGMIASMAAILMQAGDERVLDENAWFMIHEISSGVRGKSSDMEDELKFVKRLQDRALSILAERSTLTKQQIGRRWKKTDDWMSAHEAQKLGFVDRVE